MTDTLTPVERTNWALSAWNSTLDWNGVPSAWLYGQDHLWATQDLVGNSGPRMFTWVTQVVCFSEGRIYGLVKP